jgi:hypothetical protein
MLRVELADGRSAGIAPEKCLTRSMRTRGSPTPSLRADIPTENFCRFSAVARGRHRAARRLVADRPSVRRYRRGGTRCCSRAGHQAESARRAKIPIPGCHSFLPSGTHAGGFCMSVRLARLPSAENSQLASCKFAVIVSNLQVCSPSGAALRRARIGSARPRCRAPPGVSHREQPPAARAPDGLDDQFVRKLPEDRRRAQDPTRIRKRRDRSRRRSTGSVL